MNASAAQAASIDVGLRAYMLGVYNHMTTALALTGFAAFRDKMGGFTAPGVGQLLFGSPLAYVIMFAPTVLIRGSASELTRCLRQKRATCSTPMPPLWVFRFQQYC